MNYIPRHLLITGGAGFIGSHFIIFMLERYKEIQIINLDKLTYASNLSNLEESTKDPRYHFVHGDICDAPLVAQLLDQYHIDTIVNFAAESHVDRSIANPEAFISNNILGTHNLLSCAYHFWKKQFSLNSAQCRFHQISTDEVYGDLQLHEPAFTENSQYRPNSPYSASKAASDHLVRSYFRTYGLPATLSHCSNNYGAHQHAEKFVPTVIRSCVQSQKIPIYGNGQNIRDWIFVEDHCEAVDAILSKGSPGNHYNVGGNNEINNIDLARLICETMDQFFPEKSPHSRLMSFVEDRPGHDFRYAINSAFLKASTGWQPKANFISVLPHLIQKFIPTMDLV